MQATKAVTFRLPVDLIRRIKTAAFERDASQQELVTAALEREFPEK